MGIPSQIARLLLREHRHKPIAGRFLAIGRQTVPLTPAQALALVEIELGNKLPVGPADLEIDMATRASTGQSFITDRGFLALFSSAQYHCLDQSSYEGADIVFDLCNPDLPAEYQGRFDFIYDGSSLDNVFDPAAAIRNLARAMRPGGRIMHLNRTARMHNDYLAFSLAWFHDFYSVNDFQDCQVYLAQREVDEAQPRWDFYRYEPVLERDGVVSFFGQDQYFFPWRHGHCLAIAEKGASSTWNRTPIQYEYRTSVPHATIAGNYETLPQGVCDYATDPYVVAALRFDRSPRRCLLDASEKVELPSDRLHYAPRISYCGSIGPL